MRYSLKFTKTETMHIGYSLKRGTFLVLLAAVSLSACRRNGKNTADPALTSAEDNGGFATDAARMEQYSNDVISIADVAAASGNSNLRTTQTTLGGCATVTNDTAGEPHILTIDFGTTNCTCLDLRNRRGKIIVAYTGRYKDSGSTHTIMYDNYYVNDMQLTGHKTVINKGTNSSGQVWYTVDVNDTLKIGADTTISWVGTRTRTWLEGYGTNDRSDDVYAIGGVTTLTRANGRVFTHTISAANPLKVAQACRWIESGVVTVSSPSFVAGFDRVVDYGYGGGGCDNKAQLTIGARTYVINMW